MSDKPYAIYEAHQAWDAARRKAFWAQVSSALLGRDPHLHDFETLARRLKLRNPRYGGKHEIPLSQIVGSVGRYSDFLGAFLPTTKKMEERWQRIASLYIDPENALIPPIEVYKVGDAYFVKDGNHRVSVANELGLKTIEADVWEYPVPAGIDPHTGIDDLIRQYEKLDFLEATRLDDLRPEHAIDVTLPGGFRELLHQIAHFQQDMVTGALPADVWQEAVTGWYDLVYTPTIRIIEDEDIIANFPERTPADLFIWLHRVRPQLGTLYGHELALEDAASALHRDMQNPLRRMWRRARGWLPGGKKTQLP
ncbi:MAG: transcriptional regulator [Anaerolineales bacterium]